MYLTYTYISIKHHLYLNSKEGKWLKSVVAKSTQLFFQWETVESMRVTPASVSVRLVVNAISRRSWHRCWKDAARLTRLPTRCLTPWRWCPCQRLRTGNGALASACSETAAALRPACTSKSESKNVKELDDAHSMLNHGSVGSQWQKFATKMAKAIYLNLLCRNPPGVFLIMAHFIKQLVHVRSIGAWIPSIVPAPVRLLP